MIISCEVLIGLYGVLEITGKGQLKAKTMSGKSKETSRNRHTVGLVVCGPCACGKSEVGLALASEYQAPFVDADAFHSVENVKKMSSGIPLTDEDRFPWLATVRQQMILQTKSSSEAIVKNQSNLQVQVGVVAACSALTKKYRKILSGTDSNHSHQTSDGQELHIIFVFLKCSQEVLQARLHKRQGHFMKANMLSSQLATLEMPEEESLLGQAVIINGDADLPSVLIEATEKLQAIFTA